MKRPVSVTPLYSASKAGSPAWRPGTDLPSSLLMFRHGDNESTKGIFRVTELSARMFAEVQRAQGRDRVTIDFEHNTLPGSEAYKHSREPRPVAGRGVAALTHAGVEILDIEWTAVGRKNAEHFGDISPAPFHLKDLTVVGLHSAALVRNGAIYDLSFCSAALGGLTIDDGTHTEDAIMEKLLAALRTAKLIAETDGEVKAVEFVTGLAARLTAVEGALAAVSALTVEKIGELAKGVAEPLVTPLATAIDGLKAEGVKREKTHLLDLARFEGKVIPLTADVIDTMTLDQLREQIAKIKSTVPLEQRTVVTGLQAAENKPAAVTDLQREVASNCKLDPAKVDWKTK